MTPDEFLALPKPEQNALVAEHVFDRNLDEMDDLEIVVMKALIDGDGVAALKAVGFIKEA